MKCKHLAQTLGGFASCGGRHRKHFRLLTVGTDNYQPHLQKKFSSKVYYGPVAMFVLAIPKGEVVPSPVDAGSFDTGCMQKQCFHCRH